MFKIKTNIHLPVMPYLVYNLLLDIENYHKVFPFYLETSKVAHDTWTIKAKMDNGIFSECGKPFEWKTQFWKDNTKYLIKTNELGAKFPLKQLIASWEIIDCGKCTNIVLAHEFEIANFVFTKHLLYPIVASVIMRNSKKLLGSIEKYCNSNG